MKAITPCVSAVSSSGWRFAPNWMPGTSSSASPAPVGYRRREVFYPLSSRVFRRSRLRLPLKALEHPLGLARLAATGADLISTSVITQSAPAVDIGMDYALV
mgnify:CR=1 FL=1